MIDYSNIPKFTPNSIIKNVNNRKYETVFAQISQIQPDNIENCRIIYDLLESLPREKNKDIFRKLGRTNLYFLMRYLLKRTDIEREWLFDRCMEVQLAPDGYLDLWAREHYKSTIITFGKTIQDILASHGDGVLTDREETFGIFSHTRPIAKGFLKQIKSEFENNELLKELYPDVLFANPRKESPKWSEDDGIIVRRKSNPKEATVEAWGLVDGQPTGKHFFVNIYDDVVTRESVTTPDMINKTTDALSLSYNLGSDGGKRRFIGTRYHYNDSYRAVIDRQTAIPRIHAATEDATSDGEPVLISRERLAEKRRDQGPYIFACFTKGTKILNEFWEETSIEDLKVGDDVVGYAFGTGRGNKAKLVKTKILATNVRKEKVFKFIFKSGRSVICTEEHKFYTGRAAGKDIGGKDNHFAYLSLGHEKGKLSALISVYNPNESNKNPSPLDAAWLAGIFDGEGSVSGNTIHISQSPEHNPEVCTRIEQTLDRLGFDYGTHTRAKSKGHKQGRTYYIKGGRQEKIRFLNICQPARGYKIVDALYKYGTRDFGKSLRDKLISKKLVGVKDVYNIQTETGNYIANGYATKNCQMLQNPKADEAQGFKLEWLRYYDSLISHGLNIYLLFDPANGKKKENDYTCGWVVGLGPDKKIRIIDVVRDRLNLTERTKLVFDWHRKYKPIRDGVRYESYGKDSDIQHIQAKQAEENYSFDIHAVGGSTPKPDRIKRLIPYFEQGNILLPRSHHYTNYEKKTCDLIHDFIHEEYLAFPVPIHDDMLDSLARLLDPDLQLTWPKELVEYKGNNTGFGTMQNNTSGWMA